MASAILPEPESAPVLVLGDHDVFLAKLCRLCGSILGKDTYCVKKFSTLIDLAFNVTQTSIDKAGTHPDRICLKCFYLVENYRKFKQYPTLTPPDWQPHSGDCLTCSSTKKLQKGGRPKKKLRCGRPKKVETIDDILNLDPRKPVPPSAEKALSHLMFIKMAQSQLPNTSVQIQTKGPQPLTVTPIPVPRKESHTVTKRTLLKRTETVKSVVQMMSGNSKEAFAAQTTSLVRSADSKEREEIMKGINTTTTISAEHVASMKATLNLPWNLLRVMRAWLKTFDVKLSPEGKVRDITKEWVGKGVCCEYAPMIKVKAKTKISQVVQTPWVYIFNLVGHVLQRLNDLTACKLLVSHAFIPDDEIHLKIGGDHGGGSFKMSYQIGNVSNPNKLSNTVIFSMFNCKDSRINLRIGLERFKSHVEKMITLPSWNGKVFRLFMFGDYEFLCHMYGLTGANGKYACLWCLITTKEMQISKALMEKIPEKRTLNHLKESHAKFMNEYAGNTKHAKLCYNVIDKVFFEIPLEQTCLPGLHMTLGIFMKFFRDIIECYCAEELDPSILKIQMDNGDPDNDYVELLKQRRKLMKEIEDLELLRTTLLEEADWLGVVQEDFDDAEHSNELSLLDGQVAQKEAEVKVMDAKIQLEDVTGPCVKSLDVTLKDIGVERQAYFSNTITGNHCHILMKEKNIVKLCDSIPEVVLREVGETDVYRNSLIECEKFKQLLRKYAVCHNIFNCARLLTDDEIETFKVNVVIFMDYFRTNWPDQNISPKMHMLEYHTYDFLNKWKTGCGFYGEQGGESAHNGINRMKHRFSNVKNDLDQMRYIMKEHLTQTNPKAQAIKPERKTRNLKRKAQS